MRQPAPWRQATKAREVAHCYGIYETLLSEAGFLDFADLISRSVGLLENHPDILAALQADFPHVLADEYQDVNRACARLVKLLAGDEGARPLGGGRPSAKHLPLSRRFPRQCRSFQPGLSGRKTAGTQGKLSLPHSHCLTLWQRGASRMEAEIGPALWHAQRGKDAETAFPAITLATAPDEDGTGRRHHAGD